MRLLLFILLNTHISHAAALPIDEFLQQVSSNNPAIHAAVIAQKAAATEVQDLNIQFLPQIDIEAKDAISELANTFPQFYGSHSEIQNYTVGIKETTNFGLSGEIAYNLTHNDFQGATFLPPPPDYYLSEPTIQLTQSLWRNGFGAKDRSDNLAKVSTAKGIYYDNLVKYRSALMDARNTYLQLYYTRKKIAALRESLKLAAQLRSWSKTRAQSELGDKSDFLQTEAAYKLRELELVSNENDLKNTSRNFNSLRGLDSDEVHEDLQPIEQTFSKVQIGQLTSLQTEANEKKLEAAKAQSASGGHDFKPQLDLNFSYGYSFVNPNLQASLAFGYHPVQTYGVVFIAPLFFSKAERLTNSHAQEVESAEYSLRRSRQEDVRDLQILVSKIQNASDRLDLSQKLEEAQKLKFDNERARHRRGRTTLFQVLQFEQDYVSAQLSRIETELEYHKNLNQLDLYEARGGVQK